MRKRGVLTQKYLEKKNLGGLFGKNIGKNLDVNKVGAISSLGTGLIGALDPGDQDGVQSEVGAGLSGALSGAAAGAALGPIGMAGGAIIGGISSLFGNNKRREEAERKRMARNEKLNAQKSQDVAIAIAEDPSVLGNSNATMYRKGGTIKGKPAKKFALQGTLLGYYKGTRSPLPSIAINPNRMLEDGGIIPTDNEGRAVIEGPSHEEGGIKIPELGVELEGGETLDGDFVFSEELGFADRHKKIMKAMEGTKKDDTPLSKNTYKKLVEQEEKLKSHQELLKRQLGEENEIDNTAEEMKSINKTVPFKNQKGLKKKALGGRLDNTVDLPYLKPNQLDLASAYKKSLSDSVPESLATGTTVGTGTVPGAGTGDEQKETTWDKLEKVAPYASNLINSFRKLPSVPDPILNQSIAPRYVSYDASRSEAVRAVRGANKVAEAQLSSSSATQATNAANLVSGIRAINEVNQAETNANAQIANRTNERNQEIARENNAKLEYANAQRVSRQLRQQELNAENVANFTDKLQLQTKDRNLRSLEDDKLMLQIAQDPTGASWRAGKEIFKRRLTPESFKELDERMSRLEEMNEEERKATLEALKSGVSSLGVSGANTPSVLVNSSTSKKKK